MKKITYIIAALMVLSAPALGAGAAQNSTQEQQVSIQDFVALTPNVTVNDGVVRLGDIFQGSGANADRVVAYAPRPGSRAVFDARWLKRVAAAYKLDWHPSSNAERVIIERASQIVSKSEIEELLHQRWIDDGGDASSRATISNRSFRLNLPMGTDGLLLNVEQMNVQPSNGRFNAVVAWGTGNDERIRLSGRVERMTEVPMLTSRVMRGALIGEADIVWKSMPEARLPRSTITEADQIIGMAAKHSLQAGKPLSSGDVRRPLLVNRGETVTMVLRTQSMQLTAKGRALQHGSRGDTIRISNLQTNTVVDAIVTGPGQARIETIVNLAMR